MTHAVSRRLVMLYATVDTFDLDEGAAHYGLSVCAASNAGLTGLLLSLDANLPPSAEGRSYNQMEAESAERIAANRANAEALVAEAARRGIIAQATTDLDHSRGVIGWLADHARLHDLVVIGADGRGLMSDRMIAENLLFEIGRPLLLVPAQYKQGFSCKTVIVAWDNSKSAARALGDALALLPEVQDLAFLIVGDEKAIPSALDDSAVASLLSRRGIAARVVRQQLGNRSIGTALQEGALELGADLLVMGGFGHSRLREFILGGATLSVFDDPRLPVLLSH